ncbi:LIMA1 [Branchiostoma lanceolatum]|uniref:LIMA1 protein n=1 Tax=Branchiostoma lanceolatum TaxID=7740 RepID=A0A8K0E559_BRALA|nr:LIMA1 [Branchiostoma lanceolatum]
MRAEAAAKKMTGQMYNPFAYICCGTKRKLRMFSDKIQDSSDKCKTCGKRVYPVEKLVADKNVYHNTCFKCAECNRTLRVGTYASIDGAIYCKPHFQQLFKLKGNYDEGFGKERAVKKWSAAQGDIPPDGIQKVEGQEPAKKQRRGRDGDAGKDDDSEDEEKTSTPSVTNKSEDEDDLGEDEDEKKTLTTSGTNKTATAKEKAEGKSSSPEDSMNSFCKIPGDDDDESEDEKKTNPASVTKKTKFFLEKIQDSKVDGPPSTKSTSASSEVTKESKVRSLKIVTPDSGVDVESPSSQKNSRKSSRSKSFSDEEEEDGRKRKGSTTKSDTPQQLLSVKERMAMYRQSAEHPSSEKIKVKSNRTPIMPKSAQNVTSRMERYQSEITSSGEARKSTSGGDDRKSVATGTLADLRKRWESGDLLTYQEKESTSGATTGDEMEETVVKSTSSASHKAIIRQEEAVVAQEIKAARSKFQSFEKDDEQKPRASQRMKTSSSEHDMNGVVDNGRSSPYRDEELVEQSNYESGRRSSTGDVEVVKSTTPTSDDRELVKAGTASNLKKRWESGDLQNYKERSGSSSSSSSEYAEEEEPVGVVASFSVEETKSAAPKLQPTPKEVPQPERREMKKSESLKKRYEEKLEKKEAKDEEREEGPRRALNRAPSFSRTMAAKFEKGAVRSRSSSSSSSSQEQDPDAEVVRATSHHHKEKPDKAENPDNRGSSDEDEEVVNLGLSARLRSMFEKGDVHNVEAPTRKSPVAIPRSTSTPDISKAGRRDSTSSSSSEEGEAHAVKTSFSDDEVEHRKAEIKGPSAKSLRAMFETNKTEESGPTTLPKAKPKSASLFKTPPLEKCRACEKTVYAMEKIATDHDTFHKSCFKCDQCKKVLSLGTFAGIHNKLYCKPHFKQLFQAKGNYDEGFGQVQRKHKWAPKSDSPEEDAQDKIEEVVEVKRPVPTRRPRSADLEEFDDKPPVQDDQDDEEFEVRRPVPVKRRSLPKSESPSESENEEEEEEEVVTRRSRSSSSSSREAPKARSHSASSGEGSRGRSHSASSEERRTKRRSGSSSSMDEEERRQRELSLKEGSVEEEIKRARLYRQKLLRDSSQDEEDC